LAQQAGIEGTVVVKAVINEKGTVLDASVLSSDVTPSMEKAALRAARECRFEPAKQGSVPVKATVIIPFDFRLK
jgi:protein TonB